jgi:O-glycosyl hydrolase
MHLRVLVGVFVVHVAFIWSASPSKAYGQATVTIEWSYTLQTIEGFGVGQVSSAISSDPNYNAGFLVNHVKKNEIMDLAFSASSGIGLSIFRTAVMPLLESSLNSWLLTGDPRADKSSNVNEGCS